MQFPSTYTTEEKLKSLSERLKYLARDTNSARLYTDKNVKSANLKLNLSLVLSKIILEVHFIDRGKNVFEKIIEEYNAANKTKLSFNDFEELNWIRIIAGEAIMPRLISHFVWQVSYFEKEGKPIDIPLDKNDLVRCLQIYSERCFQNSRLTISKIELENVLSKFAFEELTIDFLIDIEVIGVDSKADNYYWKGGEYSRHLKNEIASTLWLLIGGENATEIEFRRFLKLNEGAEIWIDDLGAFLNHKNTKIICDLAVLFLINENDLLKSNAEFTKIWLDAENYRHIDIKSEIPVVEFNYNNAYDFIESVNYHKWRFQDAFDYQRTRSFCHSLLRIIVLCEPKHPTPYKNVLKILKDTSRPSLLWTLYSDIKREFPFVIPYLLTDSELLPIAFKLLDKIEIDNLLLSEQSNNDRKVEESCEVKNQFWVEMFELSLDQIISVHSNDKEKGELIAKILIDVSEKVFSINSNNRNSIINHNAFRKRYDIGLKKLANKKITTGNTYPRPPVSPRLVHSLLPDISNYLNEKTATKNPNHIEHLNLNHGFIDLCIEMLRLANLRVSEFEISADEKVKLDNSSKDIITLLQKEITEFYSATEIDVQLYNTIGTEKKKAKRGVSSFGFEIIDWGYLYLHFEKSNLLQSVHVSFIASINFNTIEDKYDEQNKEQCEKIKLYLKSLMLAFISINQKKDFYEIDGLPVKPTLEKLESWIRELSLKYSIDEIPKEQIDVFNERFNVFGNDLYYQQLTLLLYRSINFFSGASNDKFVESLSATSFDTGRMLAAMNILESKALRDILSKRIDIIKTEKFIEQTHTVTELQNAMIEAVNSIDNWSLAEPLLNKIEEHYNRVKHFDENSQNLLYEVKLLLAFKEKNISKLSLISIPKSEYHRIENNQLKENRKAYLIALHYLYTENKYSEAISKLESLHSTEEENIDYAFHLLRAKTLKAISEKGYLPFDALDNWKEFVSRLSENSLKSLSTIEEAIEHNNLHYHISNNNFSQFENSISKLTNRFLYDEEVLSKVFEYYLKHGMEELALSYLKGAEKYFEESGKDFPSELKTAIAGGEKADTIKVKASLEKLLGLKPSNVIAALPSVHNGETDLNTFILIEVIQGLKNLIDKKASLKTLKKENELNDVLQVIIKPRLALWGWSIPDQSRAGKSPTGKDAGETDFVIEAGGKKIALIEALVLKGKEKAKTQKHILKGFDYVDYLQRYYVVTYFKGPSANFDHTWDEYKLDVLEIDFPPIVELDKTLGFQLLPNNTDDVRQIKISKTTHKSNVEVFHIMINLTI